MTMQHDALPARSLLRGESPAPVSLETIGLIEQALADTLRALRRTLAEPAERDEGEAEYASWLTRER